MNKIHTPRKSVLAMILAALLLPGALLLALPGADRTTAAPDRWLAGPVTTEPGLLYSGPASFSLPLVVPLESAIGLHHLAPGTIGSRFHVVPQAIPANAEPYLTSAPFIGFARPWLRMDFLSPRFSYFARRLNFHASLAYRRTAIDEFNPGAILRAELFAGYAPGAQAGKSSRSADFDTDRFQGKGLQPPVNLLLGLTADYHYADVYRDRELTTSEYGTVFLAPGLQLAGRRMLFEATVELPLRRTGHIPDRYRDRVRGNIGMKYFLR